MRGKTFGTLWDSYIKWGFRYAFWIDGKQKDSKRTTDKNGNPFKTKAADTRAREAAIIEAHSERMQKPPKLRMTVVEVFVVRPSGVARLTARLGNRIACGITISPKDSMLEK